MKHSFLRIIAIAALFIFLVSSMAGCFSQEKQPIVAVDFSSYRSLVDITEDEVQAIEALRSQGASFIFGTPMSTEAFSKEDGAIGGYIALLCDWLTEFYEIPFEPKIMNWNELFAGLSSGDIHFGPISPSAKHDYLTSDPIIQRGTRIFWLEENVRPDISELGRPPRFVFMEGTTLINDVAGLRAPGSYEAITVGDHQTVYQMLKNGEADAFIGVNTAEINFGPFDGVVSEDFLPLNFVPISMVTGTPELEAIVSVVSKALRAGAYEHLTDLYQQGYEDYKGFKFRLMLDEEEVNYLRNNPVIPFVSQYNFYPYSFYNVNEGKWEGVAYEVMDELTQITGLTFEQKNEGMLEMAELFRLLESNEAHFTPFLVKTEKRMEKFIWADTNFSADRFILISKNDYPNIEFSDIPFEKIGFTSDSVFEEVFRSWFPNAMYISEYANHDDTFAALDRGEIHLIVADQSRLSAMTSYYELSDYKANYLFNADYEASFSFNQDQIVLCSIVNKAFSLIDIDRISEQWRSKTYNLEALKIRGQRPWLIGFSVLVFLLLTIVSFFLEISNRERKMIKKQAAEQQQLSQTLRESLEDIAEKNEHIHIMLENSPVGVTMYDKDFKFIDCNQAMLNMYGTTKEIYREFFGSDAHSPEFQPDGSRSKEKVLETVQRVFDGEEVSMEWYHNTPDGEHLPVELTLTRIKSGDGYIGLSYVYDLRYRKEMQKAIEYNQKMLWAVNSAAAFLLDVEIETFEEALQQAMKSVAEAISVDRMFIYQNHRIGEELHCTKIHHWPKDSESEVMSDLSYTKHLTELEEPLSMGNYIQSIVSKMPVEHQALLVKQGILSMMVMPIIMRNEFWGHVCFCECKTERVFTKNEEAILRSASLLFGHAHYRNEMLQNIRENSVQLEEALFKANEASRAKTAFLARMSHEIRTPMNAVIGMTELALRDEDLDTKNEHIFMARQASTNLFGIINDILDFSKIEAGKMEIVPSEYSISSLVDDVVSIVRMKVIDSRIRFAVKVDKNIPHTLYGDEMRIRQAILNILSNAVKYTEDGFVSFGVYGEYVDDETIHIKFESIDSGIGIKKEDIDRLFTDFTQFDLEKNRAIEGVGLGLAITYSIVSVMGGSITVDSEYGKGSNFTIILPQKVHSKSVLAAVQNPDTKNVLIYERRHAYADSLIYSLENLGVEYTRVISGTELYEAMESREFDFLFISYGLFKKNEDTVHAFGKNMKVAILTEFGQTVPQKNLNALVLPVYCTQIANVLNDVYGKSSYTVNEKFTVGFTAPTAKVLVVDDIGTNLEVARGLLAPYGMRIDLCENGASSIEAICSEHYDLVFMDHKMPGIDGVEATRRIRAMGDSDPYYKELPIIVLTANAVSGMVEFFMENGFSDFLDKPINTVKLNAFLEKWIPSDKKIKV